MCVRYDNTASHERFYQRVWSPVLFYSMCAQPLVVLRYPRSRTRGITSSQHPAGRTEHHDLRSRRPGSSCKQGVYLCSRYQLKRPECRLSQTVHVTVSAAASGHLITTATPSQSAQSCFMGTHVALHIQSDCCQISCGDLSCLSLQRFPGNLRC